MHVVNEILRVLKKAFYRSLSSPGNVRQDRNSTSFRSDWQPRETQRQNENDEVRETRKKENKCVMMDDNLRGVRPRYLDVGPCRARSEKKRGTLLRHSLRDTFLLSFTHADRPSVCFIFRFYSSSCHILPLLPCRLISVG